MSDAFGGVYVDVLGVGYCDVCFAAYFGVGGHFLHCDSNVINYKASF